MICSLIVCLRLMTICSRDFGGGDLVLSLAVRALREAAQRRPIVIDHAGSVCLSGKDLTTADTTLPI